MDDLYELHTVLEQQNLELFQLNNKIKLLEAENRSLKYNVEQLALENSKQLEKPKRKLSQCVIDRWKYYHENKADVAKRFGLSDWRVIKSKCDELFASLK